jgi:hypothetical protein
MRSIDVERVIATVLPVSRGWGMGGYARIHRRSESGRKRRREVTTAKGARGEEIGGADAARESGHVPRRGRRSRIHGADQEVPLAVENRAGRPIEDVVDAGVVADAPVRMVVPHRGRRDRAAGHAVDSGVYLARLSVQGRELTTRLVLIR